jgi:ribose transport system substrate-binding protein
MTPKGILANSVGRRTYLRALGGTAALGALGTTGHLRQDDSLRFGLSTHFTSGAWVTALVEGGQFYAQDQGYDFDLFTTGGETQKQINDVRQMVNQGFDGIVLIPFNSEAIASAVEEAVDAGVPVITVDIDAATPADLMHISWDDERATQRATEMLISNLREQKPDQEAYTLLEVRAPPGRDIARLRHEPFVEMVEETEGFEVAGPVVGDWVRSTAKQRVREWVNANEVPDGVYSANFGMSLGALSALQEMDATAPRGEDDHVVMTQLDGSQNTHEAIQDGFIDGAVDQPNYFYAPLAFAWLERVASEGEGVLPDVGSTVVSGKGADEETTTPNATTPTPEAEASITIEPAMHKGVELWQEPIWSPATVEEALGHRQFVTSQVEITEENADAPYLWGNIWSPGEDVEN